MNKKYLLVLLALILSACGEKSGDQSSKSASASLMSEILKSKGCSDDDLAALRAGTAISDNCRLTQEALNEVFVSLGCKSEDFESKNPSDVCKDAAARLKREFRELVGCSENLEEDCANQHAAMASLGLDSKGKAASPVVVPVAGVEIPKQTPGQAFSVDTGSMSSENRDLEANPVPENDQPNTQVSIGQQALEEPSDNTRASNRMDDKITALLTQSGCTDADVEAQKKGETISQACHVKKKALEDFAKEQEISFDEARIAVRAFLGCESKGECRLLKHPENR